MESQSPILVLVTLQRSCARLIRQAADMAMARHCPIHVLHVVTDEWQPVQSIDSKVLDYLYALAGEAGAEMTVLRAEVALTAIAEFARRENVKQILMGGGEHADGIAETLSLLLPNVQVMIMADA